MVQPSSLLHFFYLKKKKKRAGKAGFSIQGILLLLTFAVCQLRRHKTKRETD
jgi:hypothetical protein